MIILSAGMPRAGSGWYYNLTNELMLANGAQDTKTIRQKYHLQKILTEVNCNIGALTPRRLLSVLVPALLGNTFVIKAHASPTRLARFLIRVGWIRAAYIYRDPRDALLSAFENGERARQRGQPNAFSSLVDFEASLDFMKDYVRISEAWIRDPSVLHTRYEDLVMDYDRESWQLAGFLQVDPEQPGSCEAIEKYRPESQPADQKGLHYSKGRIGRFRDKFTFDEQERLNTVFEGYLKRMNYPV